MTHPNVFYIKMNIPEYVNQHMFVAETQKYFPENLKEGDLAFVRLDNEILDPVSLKRVWRFKGYQNTDIGVTALFEPLWKNKIGEEIFMDPPIPVNSLTSLDFFMLDVNTMNKITGRFTHCFFEIFVSDRENFDRAMLTADSFKKYCEDKKHYRSIVVVDSADHVNVNSKDIQLYKNGKNWCIHRAEFISKEMADKFKSERFYQFEKSSSNRPGGRLQRQQLYDKLNGETNINPPLKDVWDLFCSEVDQSCETKVKGYLRDWNKEHQTKYKFKDMTIDDLKVLKIEMEKEKNSAKGNSANKWKTRIIDMEKYIAELENNDSIGEEVQKGPEEINKIRAYAYDSVIKNGENRVIYGTPGCGKSHYVKHELLEKMDENGVAFERDNIIRVTFHQDYTNTDFVGQILPKLKADKTVTYQFVPGPFTLALERAIFQKDKKVALVIEELNRGNAAAIFGDLFQLLDRKDGVSEYELTNILISEYLKDEQQDREGFRTNELGSLDEYGFDYIKLPSNLFIFATMNTGDQNVFTLDTAFKRRWKFQKISNTFSAKDEKIAEKFIPGLDKVTWGIFVNTINEYMISNGTFDSEDKQLGKYFVSEEWLLDQDEDDTEEKRADFAYKVLEYLWNDVAKFDREKWFADKCKTLDNVIEEWKKGDGKTVFHSSIKFDGKQ